MRFSGPLFICLLTCVACFTPTSTDAQNIVENHSFEIFDHTAPPADYFSPWEWDHCLTGTLQEPHRAAHGVNFVTVCGEVYQDLTTVKGQTYALTFALKTHTGQVNNGPLHVSWDDTVIDSIPTVPSTVTWTHQAYIVTAEATTTRLSFSTLPDQSHPGIDLVRVYPFTVPEPSVWALSACALVLVGGVRYKRHTSKRSVSQN